MPVIVNNPGAAKVVVVERRSNTAVSRRDTAAVKVSERDAVNAIDASTRAVEVAARGARGPRGLDGAAAAAKRYDQPSLLIEWVINHNLGYRPQVEIYSPGGVQTFAGVTHFSDNTVVVAFDTPANGYALLL